MIVSEPKDLLEAWFRVKTGIKHRLEDCTYLGAKGLDGKIRSVLVFHNHEGRDIEIDVPPSPIPRDLLRAARRYVVDQCKCDRVTFKMRRDNDKSQLAAIRLGAKLEGVVRRFYPDGSDQLIYGLMKEDYPF